MGATYGGQAQGGEERRQGTPGQAQLNGAVGLCARRGSKTTVQPGDKGQVPREHLGLVLRVAVHGTESPAGADRPVAHHPAQVVCQILIPFLGQAHEAAMVAFGRVDGEVARHREPVVGTDSWSREVQDLDPVVSIQVLSLDIAPVGREEAVAWSAPDLHAVVEAHFDHLVVAGDHQGVRGRQLQALCRLLDIRGVMGVDAERLTFVDPGKKLTETDEALVSVD